MGTAEANSVPAGQGEATSRRSFSRGRFGLNADNFPVTASLGGDPAKAKAVNWVDKNRFRNRTDIIGADRELVARARLKEFTRNVQRALKKCTVKILLCRRNHLRLTSKEKEVISLRNRARKDWSR